MAMARWRQNQMAMKRATVIMATSGNEDGDQDEEDSCLFVCLLLLINLSLSPKNLLFELFFCLFVSYI